VESAKFLGGSTNSAIICSVTGVTGATVFDTDAEIWSVTDGIGPVVWPTEDEIWSVTGLIAPVVSAGEADMSS
jgi:hypothetical protein